MKIPLRIIGSLVTIALLASSGGVLSATATPCPGNDALYNASYDSNSTPIIQLAQSGGYMTQQRLWQDQQRRMLDQQRWQEQQLRQQRQQEAARRARQAQEQAARAQRIQQQRESDQKRRIVEQQNRLRQERFKNQRRALKKKQDEQASSKSDITLSPSLTERLQKLTRQPANDNKRVDNNRTGGGGADGPPSSLTKTFNERVKKNGENSQKQPLSKELQAKLDALKSHNRAAIGTVSDKKKTAIWTPNPNKSLNPAENAFKHWKDHSKEFPEYKNAKEYVEGARSFMDNPPPGTLRKTRVRNGQEDEIFYHPPSNRFAVRNAQGVPRTMFKPDPKVHGQPSNMDYFNVQ